MSTMSADTEHDQGKAVTDSPLTQRKRVVIVGGGFAGLAAAHALRHADAEVVLIDRRNHHIFQPLLYQVATAVLSPAEIAAPIRQLEAKQQNLRVLLAEVTGVNVASHRIEAYYPGVGVRKIPFGFLVVATGMNPSYFGHDGFARDMHPGSRASPTRRREQVACHRNSIPAEPAVAKGMQELSHESDCLGKR
jgi:NADH:ubiquinone reductase (H+-translocating)